MAAHTCCCIYGSYHPMAYIQNPPNGCTYLLLYLWKLPPHGFSSKPFLMAAHTCCCIYGSYHPMASLQNPSLWLHIPVAVSMEVTTPRLLFKTLPYGCTYLLLYLWKLPPHGFSSKPFLMAAHTCCCIYGSYHPMASQCPEAYQLCPYLLSDAVNKRITIDIFIHHLWLQDIDIF